MSKRETDIQTGFLEDFVASGLYKSDVYGKEWGDPLTQPTLRTILRNWIIPCVKKSKTCMEIGVGGGRWYGAYRQHVKGIILVDGTSAAEKAVLAHWPDDHIRFIVSKDGSLPLSDGVVDYVLCFDTAVHFFPELLDACIKEVSRALSPGGTFHFNFAHKKSATMTGGEGCYIYRDESDVYSVLASAGLKSTGRQFSFGGYGSLLVEATKE